MGNAFLNPADQYLSVSKNGANQFLQKSVRENDLKIGGIY